MIMNSRGSGKEKGMEESGEEWMKDIREQTAVLAEEMNFRLLCFQLEGFMADRDRAATKLLEKAGLYPVWEFLACPQDILWVDSIEVMECGHTV